MRSRPVEAEPPACSMIKRHRMRLVGEPQAAVAIAGPRVGGIEEHAAAGEDAIGLRNQRADPAHVEIVVGGTVDAGEAFVDEGAHRRIPVPAVGGVDRELLARLGDLHAAAREAEAAGLAVKREDVDAVAERQHQRGLRTVGDEARRELRRAALMEGETRDRPARAGSRRSCPTVMLMSMLEEPSSGSIATQIFAFAVADLRLAHLLRRQRRDRQLAEAAAQDRIRLDVEVALDVAVAVAAGGQARGVREIAGGDEVGDLDRGRRDGIDRGRDGQRMRRRLGIALKVVVQPELPGHLRPSPCGRRIQFPPRRRSVAVGPGTRRLTGAA